MITLDGEIFSSPVVHDSKLFIGCRDDYLYAFNISKIEWISMRYS